LPHCLGSSKRAASNDDAPAPKKREGTRKAAYHPCYQRGGGAPGFDENDTPRPQSFDRMSIQPLPHGSRLRFGVAAPTGNGAASREGVEMARRVTDGDESHEWSDVDGEYLANSGVTFA